jgi:hypothetical protein
MLQLKLTRRHLNLQIREWGRKCSFGLPDAFASCLAGVDRNRQGQKVHSICMQSMFSTRLCSTQKTSVLCMHSGVQHDVGHTSPINCHARQGKHRNWHLWAQTLQTRVAQQRQGQRLRWLRSAVRYKVQRCITPALDNLLTGINADLVYAK